MIKHKRNILIVILLVLMGMLVACGNESNIDTSFQPIGAVNTENSNKELDQEESKAVDTITKTEDMDTVSNSGSDTVVSTYIVKTPEAAGTKVFQNNKAIIDYSNSETGYVMAKYLGNNQKVKLLVTGPDGIRYTYSLYDKWDVFPLTAGNGSYQIGIYENISGTSYLPALTETLEVTLIDDHSLYLYPNQYVDFTAETEAVQISKNINEKTSSPIDKVSNVYNYVLGTLTYDYEEAETVESGYTPVLDEVVQTQKGICFDYASLMAAMLRTQGIPTMLQIGYAGEVYHAWVSIYTDATGWINGIIEFDGENWKLMDPTFADGQDQSDEIMNYIGDTDNYKVMYKH